MTTPGTWPQLRHDNQLSGVQSMPGNITEPKVAWKHFLGGILYHAQVISEAYGKSILMLVGGCIIKYYARTGTVIWKSDAHGFDAIFAVQDVDNCGCVEIVAGNGKSVFTLNVETGAVLWQEYLGPPFSSGINLGTVLVHRFAHVSQAAIMSIALLSAREVFVYDFASGASHPTRKHMLWMDDFYHPSLLAADIDGDGNDELIVTKLSAVYVFDVLTGQLKNLCVWESGGSRKRNYGLFLAQDLTGNGKPDLVVMAHLVSRHIAVLNNDGSGSFTNAWDRFIEHIYPSDEKELRYIFSPCEDIDGDGRLEMVVSIFNEHGDNRWWLEVIDAQDGSIKARVPDVYLRGIRDVIFGTIEHTRHPSDFGRCVALEWTGGELKEVWGLFDVGFIGRFLDATARRTVVRSDLVLSDEIWCCQMDGSNYVMIRGMDGSLSVLHRENGVWILRTIPDITGVATILAIEDLDGDGQIEFLIAGNDSTVRSVRMDGSVQMMFQSGMRLRYGTGLYYTARPMSTPIVFNGFKDRMYCAVPDGGSRVHLLRMSNETNLPEVCWVRHGRGRIGPEETHHSVTAVQLEGEAAVLMSQIGEGPAEMVAVDVHGLDVKCWQIPLLPTSPEIPRNRTGISDYVFIQRPEEDLLVVSGYRSPSMNSDRMVCIDARHSEELWSGTIIGEGEEGRGFGAWNAMTTMNKDANTEITFLAKDIVCRLDAHTGSFNTEPWYLRAANTMDLQRRGITTDDFAAYGSLVPCDVDGDGVSEYITMANYGGIGVINSDNSIRWWRSGGLSMYACAFGCAVDVDGDGVRELAISTVDGDFLCLSADTGNEKWRLHLNQVCSDIVACDIDNDGRAEFIVSTREGNLLCIGTWRNGVGYVKWTLPFGYSLGPPIIADMNGDGVSEILVVCGDGNVYCVS